MTSETSETTLQSGGGEGGGGGGEEAEQKRKGNSSLTFSLSFPYPFRRLPRRLQKCRLEELENSMTCHELGFLYLFVCLLGERWWGEVGKQLKQLPEKLNR